jgi:hypothetical protein
LDPLCADGSLAITEIRFGQVQRRGTSVRVGSILFLDLNEEDLAAGFCLSGSVITGVRLPSPTRSKSAT